MGAKQHCAELEKQGVVDTWRRPKPVGRPELVYRLTPKAAVFFPAETNVSTIDILNAARQLFGATASDKLLLALFRKKAETYAQNLRGDTREARVESLARLRDAEGHLSEVVKVPDLMIQEYHSPILDLVDAFPLVRRLEKEMFETLLGASVERHEELGGARAQIVDRPRHELLAGSGLAGDQHGALGRPHLADEIVDRLHRR